ncbi:MAG TPA: SDR family NAD(P)-dependent oxidoreductase [Actinomycetota bacterium]|nr:SDR family NAD(P)-dependent oxidoreductase [Actinomycetota bacterium]
MSKIELSLEGKVALVTGASRGIGRAIAVAFGAHGAAVSVSARNVEDLEQTAKLVEEAGGRALVVPCDVTQTDQVEAMVHQTISGLGGLEIIVNNAGGTRFMSPLAAMREDGWNKVIDLNLTSVFRVCKAVAPHLIEQKKGSVINISSIDGVEPTPLRANYSAAKAGVIALTRVLSQEWAELGIRVNTISPGAVSTEIWGSLIEDEHFVKMVTDRIPMKRWATPEEIASTAVYLASDAASYVTGANFIVDGGSTA